MIILLFFLFTIFIIIGKTNSSILTSVLKHHTPSEQNDEEFEKSFQVTLKETGFSRILVTDLQQRVSVVDCQH